MTDFTVFQQSPFTAEDLSWNITPPENEWFLGGTLDLSKFTAAQHWPNGVLLSGCVLGVVTATGLLGPYKTGNADGTQTAVGILRHSIQVVRYVGGATKVKVGAAYMVHGMVSQARLPYTSGNAASGGFLDAGAQTALKNIYFAA